VTKSTFDPSSQETDMAKNVICLWFDKDAEEAAQFYARTFPNSAVKAVHRARAIFRAARKVKL
jgi:predicted 3-demethylubiquinone-9 3-methyltransferase (glyoxalase superfamily)